MLYTYEKINFYRDLKTTMLGKKTTFQIQDFIHDSYKIKLDGSFQQIIKSKLISENSQNSYI